MDELKEKFARLECLNKKIADVKQKILKRDNKNKISKIISTNQVFEGIKLHKEMPNNFDLNNFIIKKTENYIQNKEHFKLRDILNQLENSSLRDKIKLMVFNLIYDEFNLNKCSLAEFADCLKTVKSFYGDIFMEELLDYSNKNCNRLMSSGDDVIELDKKITSLLKCITYGVYLDKGDVYCILEQNYISRVSKNKFLETKDDVIFFKDRITKRCKLFNNKTIEDKIQSVLLKL